MEKTATLTFTRYCESIRAQLAQPLPGTSFQEKMSPSLRAEVYGRPHQLPARQSGVLILLYPLQNIPHFALIRRTNRGDLHGGQTALPGGAFEPNDKDTRMTALRETEEELGVSMDLVTIIGKLTELYIYVSNFWVNPYVGYVSRTPEFQPNPDEVEVCVGIPTEALLLPENKKECKKTIRGTELIIPTYIIGSVEIWGATAMILSEFEEVLRRCQF